MNTDARCKASWIPYLRWFHSAPDISSVDVYLNAHLMANQLDFAQMSEELPISAGAYTLHVCKVGNPANKIISQAINVTPGTSLCAIVGNGGNFETIMIKEPYLVVDEGKSLLRFANLSSLAVDIAMADGHPSYGQIAVKTVGEYRMLPAGRYTFQVNYLDRTVLISLSQHIELSSERAHTVYLLDNNEEQPSLKIVISQDRNTCVAGH